MRPGIPFFNRARICLALVLGLGVQMAGAQPFRYVDRLGFYTGDFQSITDGYQDTLPYNLTETGFLTGSSLFFDPVSGNTIGQVIWTADTASGQSHRVGLWSSPEFTSSLGEQVSEVSTVNLAFESTGINDAGYVAGVSLRFNGGEFELGSASWVASAVTQVTNRVGFYTDPEYTGVDGEQLSYVYSVNNAGYAAGLSQRFVGNDNEVYGGQATWLADGATGATTRVGLFGAEYTVSGGADDGYQYSDIAPLTESGWAMGYSDRFLGEDYHGSDVWVANTSAMTTQQVGLFTGPEFETVDGYRESEIFDIKENGMAIGISERVGGLGTAVWMADAATGDTTRIGLFDAEFTASDDYQYSETYFGGATQSGYVIGHSTRFNGVFDQQGQAAWVADFSTGQTRKIGFYGAEYTSTDPGNPGYYESTAHRLTESGYVSGESHFFTDTTSSLGTAAWVHNVPNDTTVRVGLYTGDEFVTPGGNQESEVRRLSESGWAFGYSNRYVTATDPAGTVGDDNGRAAWIASGDTGATTRIGLYTTSEFVSATTGLADSTIRDHSESGLAVGVSTRFGTDTEAVNYGLDNGTAAWLASGTTGQTTRLGLTGADYTGTDGYQVSEATLVTDSGFVGGYSSRFDGDFDNGGTAWLYDSTAESMTEFLLSMNSTTGYAFSEIELITEAGIVLGTFSLFDGEDDLGLRLFAYVPGWTEALQVDQNLDVSLALDEWAYFYDALEINGELFIVGPGTSNTLGEGAYLIQIVPEPSAGLLVLGAVLGYAIARRRRRAA